MHNTLKKSLSEAKYYKIIGKFSNHELQYINDELNLLGIPKTCTKYSTPLSQFISLKSTTIKKI